MADELRKPKVPHEDEPVMAPQLVMEGLRAGLGAAVQMSQQRRQTQSDIARLAAQEKANEQSHELDMAKLDMAAEMMPMQKELSAAHAQYYRNGAVNKMTNAARDFRFNQQKESLVNDVNAQADKLGLTNPRFPTDDPVGYGAAALKFKRMYQHSPEPWLKHTIGQYMATADQQKIGIRRAARDAEGNWKANDNVIQVPYWQVADKLQNPATREEAMEELRAGGHFRTEIEKGSRPATSGFKKLINSFKPGAPLTESYDIPKDVTSPAGKMLLEKEKTTDFSPVKSRVPTATLPSSARGGTSPTQMPIEEPETNDEYPDTSSVDSGDGGYAQTDTDQILGQARKALELGADPALVTARMKEYGLDSSLLS